MKTGLALLLLLLGSPLPALDSFDEDVVVEVTKVSRVGSGAERRKSPILPAPPDPKLVPPRPSRPLPLARPSFDPDVSTAFCRPPPAA
jgi:hypothetical protein